MTDGSSTERFRLFVAIPVPDAVRHEMIRVQCELQPLAPHGAVRWARPEQFHLTLRFLGDVSSNRVTALQESVRAVCAGVPALHLCARGVGFFPNAHSPRVVWVGVNDDENRLVDLQKKIESSVHPFTAEQGGEHFAGHVTLGRFKQFKRREIEELMSRTEAMKNRQFGRWMALDVEIVRSELSRIGTVYTRLGVFPLAQIEPV